MASSLKSTSRAIIPDDAGVSGEPDRSIALSVAEAVPKASILMVDDRPDKLLSLEAVLSGLGQDLVKARSGREALRHLLKRDFAVILLDVSMPGMDGFETAALIRQRRNSEHTPIIFITSINTNENHIAHGYSLGAVDYLFSPIVPEVLRAKVSVFVELHRQAELVRRQAEQLRVLEESRHRRELAEVEDRLDAETRRNRFFTLALDMLAIASLDGQLILVNPSWQRVLGFAPGELTSRRIWELANARDQAAFKSSLEQLSGGPGPVQFECGCPHKDGSSRWVHWTVAPFLAENLFYVFAQDVTAQRDAEAKVLHLHAQLQNRVAALTDANRELEAFNYSIAHDLRAPLRSMTGFAMALVEEEAGGLTPMGLDYARRISASAKYMDNLLLDLLAYSGLARAKITPELLDLDVAVKEQIAVMEKEIHDRGAQIEVVSPLGKARAHLPTLKQVLSNLIENGLKFVERGKTPLLRIYSTRTRKGIRLWVQDNGIGVPPAYQRKVFGLFQRLHDSRKYPGTGIGLALVRKGAERMGGGAGVESIPGQGSRFWVEIPEAQRKENGEQNLSCRG